MKKKFFPLCHTTTVYRDNRETVDEYSVQYGTGFDTPEEAHKFGMEVNNTFRQDGDILRQNIRYSGAVTEIILFDETLFYGEALVENENQFDPATFDHSLVRTYNAKGCEGCGERMALLKSGTFQCSSCGGYSTAFGGFWTWEEMQFSFNY